MFYLPKPPIGYPFISSNPHVLEKLKRKVSFLSIARGILFGIVTLIILVFIAFLFVICSSFLF